MFVTGAQGRAWGHPLWDIGTDTRRTHGPKPRASPLFLDALLAAYRRVVSIETLFCTFELLKIERH